MYSNLNTLAKQVIDTCIAEKQDLRRSEYSRLSQQVDFDELGNFQRAIAKEAFERLRGTKPKNMPEQRHIGYMACYVLDAVARGEEYNVAMGEVIHKFSLSRGELAAFTNRLDQELIARLIA